MAKEKDIDSVNRKTAYTLALITLKTKLWDSFDRQVPYGILIRSILDRGDNPEQLPTPPFAQTLSNQKEWLTILELYNYVKQLIAEGAIELKQEFKIDE